MTITDPGAHACRICRAVLNLASVDGHRRFIHPRPPADGHTPDPVPLEEMPDAAFVCDFCSSSNPVWSYEFEPPAIIVVDPRDEEPMLQRELGRHWSTCTPCARLIEARDAAGLTRRALRRVGDLYSSPVVEQAAPYWAELHRLLIASGPRHRRPLRPSPTPPATGQTGPAHRLRPTHFPKIRDGLARYWRQHSTDDVVAAMRRGTAIIPAHLVPGAPDDRAAVAIAWPYTAPVADYASLMGAHTEHAALYWIDSDFSALARHAAATLPEVQVSEHEVPATEGLLIWSEAVCTVRLPGVPHDVPIVAVQWGRIPGGTWVTFHTTPEAMRATEPSGPELQQIRERIGWLAPVMTGNAFRWDIPHVADDDTAQTLSATLIATWLLIAQPYAEQSHIEPDKAIRKAYARKSRPMPPVRLVRLRPRKPQRAKPNAEKTRDYSQHRWYVPGFWRERQPHGPGRKLRKRVYVQGHWKGPEDAPLLMTPKVNILGSARPPKRPAD
ncbi:hypothetical protein [Micromonospora sp. CPCC 206061]|uniref:hypothetical protein n=1 Tax=Micromonospora sp. CPCC 206061 TaxID=3122410 RepID=UPI002FF08158